MKTLRNHLILFDEECPMCRVYTKAFVNTGLLDNEGRASYQETPQESCPMLDRQRAVNEIALIDQETGEVTYGIESLFKVLAVAMPVFKPLFEFKPFVWIMAKVYAFIAFNRRVIIPPPDKNNSFQLQPTFKLNYRIAYLVFAWVISAYIFSGYGRLIETVLTEAHFYDAYFICGGLIICQGLIISIIDRKKIWNYLGNMMTISIAGALILLPVLLISEWISLHLLFYDTWFIAMIVLMLLEHIRRVRLLKVNQILTGTWIFYHSIVLYSLFK